MKNCAILIINLEKVWEIKHFIGKGKIEDDP